MQITWTDHEITIDGEGMPVPHIHMPTEEPCPVKLFVNRFEFGVESIPDNYFIRYSSRIAQLERLLERSEGTANALGDFKLANDIRQALKP